VIRPARPGEARLLSDLALRSKGHWGYSREFLEACRDELTYTEDLLRAEHMRFFVLEERSDVIGFHALERLDPTLVQLEALFVEPAQIGRGWGRRLIEHAKRTAADLGAKRMVIQGDPHAEAFYLAAGGVVTGRSESASIPGRFLPTFAIELASGDPRPA
jgi:GNAT superfamily N-acetyltransferase